MKKIHLFAFLISLWVGFGFTSCNRQLDSSESTSELKPYRTLIIISDQWNDPLSYNIDTHRVNGEEFIDVVTMLKIWGIPFDILRLDEQRLQINRFLDGAAKPKYGCIIWMADPEKIDEYSADFQVLERAVYEYGISFVGLFDFVANDRIAGIIGIDFQDKVTEILGNQNNKIIISGGHVISPFETEIALPDGKLLSAPSIPTGNFDTPTTIPDGPDTEEVNLVRCSATDAISVIGTFEGMPQLTVREISKATSAIWIGGGRDWFRKYRPMRDIFRKSLVRSIGYGIFNDNFENGFIFIMDDVGCSEHAWSLRWHYPTPSKETLIKYLIEPLEERGLMMVQNVTPGYANPESHMIEVPWDREPFTDIFGNLQDYGSTKAGLEEGLRRGVFEIQPHRAWSHMNWDLQSPPGPWWDGPVDGEISVVDWYNEVVDVRRGGIPVPSNDLLFIYRTGIDAIKQAFGVVPLSAEVRTPAELREGTHGGDDNGRIASIAGIGVSRECYVGQDFTIEFSMMMPQQITCHDLDLTAKTNSPADTTDEGWDSLLSLSTEQLLESKIAGGRRINLRDNTDWIDKHKDKYWMGFNETCGYLHTKIGLNADEAYSFDVQYDPHYCQYFETKESSWTLEFSDHVLEDLGENPVLMIDHKKYKRKLGTLQKVTLPAGIGSHVIKVVID